MTCLRPPQTLTEFVGVIDCTATAIAGPTWPVQALLGALVVLLAVVFVAAAVITRREHP